MPLDTATVCVDSAATFRLVGAPDAEGVAIDAAAVAVTNAEGVTVAVAAVQTGDAWEATFPATHFAAAGSVANGYVVSLSGTDERGARRNWIAGRGALKVLSSSPIPEPGETVTNITDKTLDGQTFDIETGDGQYAALRELITRLGGAVAGLMLCAATAFAAPPPGYTNNTYSADGVTWTRHGALNTRSSYVVTDTTPGGGGMTTNDVQGIVAAATQDVARLGQDAYFSNLTVRASEHTYSISVGRTNAVHATALGSLAAGFYNVAATRNAAVALGNHAQGTNEVAFVWSGQASQPYYGSHGAGTFNLNPAGGAEGIYVGDARLPAVIAATVTNTVPSGVFTAWTITRDGVDVTADVGEPYFNTYDNMWDIAPTLVAGDTPFLQFIDGAADDLRLEYDAVQDYDPSLPMPRYVAVRREVMRNALGLARLSDLPDAKPAARLLLKGADGKTYSLTINASQALIIDEVTE